MELLSLFMKIKTDNWQLFLSMNLTLWVFWILMNPNDHYALFYKMNEYVLIQKKNMSVN